MKKCPYCAEEIQDEAIVCRYCGRDLTKPVMPQPGATQGTHTTKKQNNTPIFVFVAVVVCAGFIILWAMVQSGSKSTKSTSTSTPQESAWYACTMFIQKQLGLSLTDAQRYTPSGATSLGANQYRVQVYYAKTGDTYRCELLRHSNGDMELLDLKVK